jgi:hypothetical protein
MNEPEFLDRHDAELAAARGMRGACPSNDRLLDFAAGALDAPAAAEVERHALLCAICRDLLERLRTPAAAPDALVLRRLERSLDRRAAPWRRSALPIRVATAAAVVLAAVATTLLLPRPVAERPVLRGSELVLAHPRGEISAIDRFDWQGAAIWSRYRIEVEVEGMSWSTESDEPRFAPPPELRTSLGAARRFRWRVVALAVDGSALAESDWAEVRMVQR